jgi:glycosyltransferase involved in cell wall biosynthesis
LPLRIAILGTRGIPARYGGFETFAEELSKRLVARGHTVTVYCRARHTSNEFLGVRLVYLPTLRHKYFDTLAHTAISTLHLLFHPVDVALYCNAANAIYTWMPRLRGIPVALNVDGLERKRKKWNRLAQAWYLLSERLSTWLPTCAVSDAEQIADYYRRRYRAETTFIPYGAPLGKVPSTGALPALGLEPGRYFLYVTRFEPENHPLLVREAFETLDTDIKLALIGDAPYAADYIRRVRDTRNPRVILPGAIYGDGYRELQSHCLAYVHATEVGGTHPALIEAMGRGCLVLYLNTPENHEVAGGVAIPFEHHELADKMRLVLSMPQSEREQWGRKAMERVAERYSWDSVTTSYERLFQELAR